MYVLRKNHEGHTNTHEITARKCITCHKSMGFIRGKFQSHVFQMDKWVLLPRIMDENERQFFQFTTLYPLEPKGKIFQMDSKSGLSMYI